MMPVSNPGTLSDKTPWVKKDGTPTNFYYQHVKKLEAYIKSLEGRIAALEP